MYCNNCGAELVPNTNYCSNCGVKINSNNNSDISNKNIKPEDKIALNSLRQSTDRIARIISKILLAIALIVLICSFLGLFDTNPIPALIILIIYVFFSWVEEKVTLIPPIIISVFEIIILIVALSIGL